MARYSVNFKEAVVRKMLLPGGKGVQATAEETGVSAPTLYGWIRKLRRTVEMGEDRTGPNERSLSEKLELLMESANPGPDALGEWLRGRGVHEEHLKLWRTEVREALESGGSATRRISRRAAGRSRPRRRKCAARTRRWPS
ncbi:MAG: transposase [Spirochaetales bacterium]|nr:transposase [Spirochaetales bacterium]